MMLWEEIVKMVREMSREQIVERLDGLGLYCGYYDHLSIDNMRKIAVEDIYEAVRER